MWSYAFRTAAESMAVTPLRLTKAVGMPWRWACWRRSARAQACGAAAKAERRRPAAKDASACSIRRGRGACAAKKITACDYGQSPNLARPGATFLLRTSRRPAWRQIPCCRARHRALVNIAASCGRAPVMAGRTRCAPPCARHATLFLPALRGSGADVGRSFETAV